MIKLKQKNVSFQHDASHAMEYIIMIPKTKEWRVFILPFDGPDSASVCYAVVSSSSAALDS